jgi:tetratricopeptide (TPR) repeat protein
MSTPRSASAAFSIDAPVPNTGMASTDEQIAFWRARFDANPEDYISVMQLGRTFLNKARETGDVADYERAEAALRKSLDLFPDYEDAQVYLAGARFAEHDFTGAFDLATHVYTTDPKSLQALATIGDAQLELGNYDTASTAYQQLLDRAPSPPAYSRNARLLWLQGRPTEAFDFMQRAARDPASVELSRETAAWYEWQLGELSFQAGRVDDAATYYEASLKRYPNYYLALAGLGKARAAQGRYDDAIALYQHAVDIIPQPDFLAGLGDLYTVTGRPEDARRQYDTVDFIGKLAAINRVVYNRQLALFSANHDRNLPGALDLATQELKVRKDIYGYDALAWTLYKNGRFQEAAQASTQAMSLLTRDATLYYHAGMIAQALGDQGQAKQLLQEALSINPHFDLLQARVAQDALKHLS